MLGATGPIGQLIVRHCVYRAWKKKKIRFIYTIRNIYIYFFFVVVIVSNIVISQCDGTLKERSDWIDKSDGLPTSEICCVPLNKLRLGATGS